MPRKAIPIGPTTLGLIEDARIDLVRAVLGLRESDNEPDFKLTEGIPDPNDYEAASAFRQVMIETLSAFDQDELRPVEQRCRRIRSLADGKGVSSLTTIVEQQFSDEQSQELEKQPDPLCRSI